MKLKIILTAAMIAGLYGLAKETADPVVLRFAVVLLLAQVYGREAVKLWRET